MKQPNGGHGFTVRLEQCGGGPRFATDVLWNVIVDDVPVQRYVASQDLNTVLTAHLLEQMGYKPDGTPDRSNAT